MTYPIKTIVFNCIKRTNFEPEYIIFKNYNTDTIHFYTLLNNKLIPIRHKNLTTILQSFRFQKIDIPDGNYLVTLFKHYNNEKKFN